MLILICISIFLSIAILAGVGLYRFLSKNVSLNERVAKLIPEEQVRPTLVQAPRKWQLFLAEMGTKLRVTPSDMHSYREQIMAAGFRPERVYVLLGVKLLLAAALPATYLFLVALPQGKMFNTISLLISIASAIAGFLLPSLWLDRRGNLRKEEIFHSLPDVLDLLTVCVEAGLSLDAALVRTAESFYQSDNALCKEITLVTLEIRAGKPRPEALKGLAERTTVDDVRSFVSMLIQTEKFGTSLGKTLRTYSDALRIRRKQLAEERAAKTAVKMLFPLTFCVFPALLVVMLAPAVVRLFDAFKK